MIERRAAALALSLLWTGCVTEQENAKPAQPVASAPRSAAASSTAGLPPPGIAFDYVLDHGAKTPAMRQCLVRFARTAGQTTVEARLKPEANRILVKVPEGSYRILDASCDNGRHFTLPNAEPFAVAPDSVTFLGEVRLAQTMASKTAERDTLSIDDRDSEENRAAVQELKQRKLTVVWHKQAYRGKKP